MSFQLNETPSSVDRRQLLRGGALLAGAAGVAAVVLTPTQAHAADGDAVLAGESNDATTTTTLRVGGDAGTSEPALALQNAEGPSMYLQPLDYEFAPEMALGEMANTELGPILGVTGLVGNTTTYLATGIDLADLPTPYALPEPVRLFDSRNPARRAVLQSSSNAFDADFRLRAGAWVDIEVGAAVDQFDIPAAYVNATATGAPAGGYLSVYPPNDNFPGTSTLNFVAKQTVANAAFVATGLVKGRYAIRVRVSTPTHVVVDLTGVSIKEPVPAAAAAARSTKARAALTARLRSTLSKRLRSTLSR